MDDEYKRARQYALKRLAAQSYHSALLGKLLMRKEFPPEIISRVIQECRRAGFLNDTLWVENFIKSRQNRYGLPLILAQLRSKGISIEELPQEHDKDTELTAIHKLLKSRYRTRDLKNYQERQKVIAALMRKGFGWEAIREAVE
jgi:regulatory protein